MINWNSLLLVASVAIGATVLIVSVFSLGVRLLTNARNIVENSKKKAGTSPVEVISRALAYACFTVCAGAVLYGIYLIVPYWHLAA